MKLVPNEEYVTQYKPLVYDINLEKVKYTKT